MIGHIRRGGGAEVFTNLYWLISIIDPDISYTII